MSYQTIYQCANDKELGDRVLAAAMKEAMTTKAESVFGKLLGRTPTLALAVFPWPLAVDNEDAYAEAVEARNSKPSDALTDEDLLLAIQTHWPTDEKAEVVTAPPMMAGVPR